MPTPESPHPPWHIHRVAETPSTNDLARDHLLRAWHAGHTGLAPDGAPVAFIAERQTAGRGQHDRPWESPPGGLYLSALVHTLAPALRSHLALIAGVAAAHALRDTQHIDAQLRWPNDLVINNLKLGGILCEAVAQDTRWAGIIGIGLNVNTRIEKLPPALRPRATSLYELTGRSVRLDTLELYLLARLADTLKRANREGLRPLVKRFSQWDALNGRQITLQTDTHTLRGTAAGIDPEGRLRLADGTTLHLIDRATLLEIDGERLREK